MVDQAPSGVPVEIVALLVSPVHAYAGRPQDGPRADPLPVARDEVIVRANLGLVGDRYFGSAAHRDASVTVFDAGVLDDLAQRFGTGPLDPHLTRRNIALRGFPVDELAAHRSTSGARTAGATFGIDSGSGLVRFQAHRPANPCAWMDVMLAPGAFRALRGHGGVRCTPLDDGRLRLGPATLTVLTPAH